jgi:transcriptional regulator with GAF, ATPase, and Fis domain
MHDISFAPVRPGDARAIPGNSWVSGPQLAPGPWSLLPIIAELAEQLIAPTDRDFDARMMAGLQALAQVLRMDWAGLRCPPARESGTSCVWCWSRNGEMPALDDALLMSLVPVPVADEGCAAAGVPVADPASAGLARAALAAQGCGFAAAVSVPLGRDHPRASGVLALGASSADHHWSATVMAHLRIAAAVFGQAIRHHEHRRSAGAAGPGDEIAAAPAGRGAAVQARHPDECDREVMQPRLDGEAVVGRSEAIRQVLNQLRQVATTDSTVLLLGETGTGKELLATRVHELSTRRARPMVRVNCAAIPATLIESELFGREKGAFTGALSRQIGRFESADRSTIFLDEIGDLPSEVQIKLLRVIEERRLERLGSPQPVPVDVRIVAATHRDLEKRIAEEAFREDLFYRLNVFPIRVPALRDRAEDIPVLVWRFVLEFARVFDKRIDTIARESMAAIQRYPWPGNIRELRNIVERAMIVATGPRLTIALPASAPVTPAVRVRLDEVEREHIRSVLERVRWRVRGAGGAAEQLGLRPTTLETRMAKLGLSRPKTA